MWVAAIFSFLQDFPIKNRKITSKKFHKKILPSTFSICIGSGENGKHHLTSPMSINAEPYVRSMSALPPKADKVQCSKKIAIRSPRRLARAIGVE
jgi:hypothetical protein